MKIKGILILLVGLLSLSSCILFPNDLKDTFEALKKNESYFEIDNEWTVTIGEDVYKYRYSVFKNNVIVARLVNNKIEYEYIYKNDTVKEIVTSDVVTESFYNMSLDEFESKYKKENTFKYNIDFDQPYEFTSTKKNDFLVGPTRLTSNFKFNDNYEYVVDLPNITETISNLSLSLSFETTGKIIYDFSLKGKNSDSTDVEVNIYPYNLEIDYEE